MGPTSSPSATYDVLGVGLGPANLAVAIALQEYRERTGAQRPDFLFLEARETAAWHPDLLVPDAVCQVPFLKDLATPRDPTSRFTFVNYLFDQGRLLDFMNLGALTPTRMEFNRYFQWAADQIADAVRYDCRVTAVLPVGDGPGVHALDVRVEGPGGEDWYRTPQLVVATGGVPVLPQPVASVRSPRVFHAHKYLSSIERLCPDRGGAYSIVVLGAGQSAADVLYHMLVTYPNARVTVVMRRASFRLLDDNPFTNEMFSPGWSEEFFDLPAEWRAWVLQEHRAAAYAIVDRAFLQRIYALLYEERATASERVSFAHLHHVAEVDQASQRVRVELESLVDGARRAVDADALVCATGYDRQARSSLLADVEHHFEHEADGSYVIGRDYAVRTGEVFAPRIRLLGFSERTHGFADPHLSTMASRAAIVRDSVLAHLGLAAVPV